MVSDHVVLWVNGTAHAVHGADAVQPLSAFLRSTLHLTGTKVACGTGDCGACTVLVASPQVHGQWTPINACIRYVFQLHGCHVLTIEGVGTATALVPAQRAVAARHASQCGFCTPGIVLSMTAVLHNSANTASTAAKAIDWPTALSGNLCRCTGYQAVLDAATEAATTAQAGGLAIPVPDSAWRDEAIRHAATPVDLRVCSPEGTLRVVRCPSLAETLKHLQTNPDAVIIGGATDFAVEQTDRPASVARDRHWLATDHLAELQMIREGAPHASGHRVLEIGAGVRWSALQEVCIHTCPPLAEIIGRVGGPQIRHAGTIGGNIMTASPIADLLPMLLVMNAEVVLTAADASRRVPIAQFIIGYRTVDRRLNELLTAVLLSLPHDDEVLRLTKVSRRHDGDIATVALAVRWREEQETLRDVAIAVGGMGPMAVRLTHTEQALEGQPATDASWSVAASQAMDVARDALHPRSDVRGAAAYRREVLRNLLAFTRADQQAERVP